MRLLFAEEFEKGWVLHLFSGSVPNKSVSDPDP
jgi:hypothetical protein